LVGVSFQIIPCPVDRVRVRVMVRVRTPRRGSVRFRTPKIRTMGVKTQEYGLVPVFKFSL